MFVQFLHQKKNKIKILKSKSNLLFLYSWAYKYNMKAKDLHYYLYKDEELIKSIYSQIYDELPDFGVIEYFGGDTQSISGDYKAEILEEASKDKRKELIKGETRSSQTRGRAIIREYANIKEIKDIKRNIFYNNIVNKIAVKCKDDNCKELIYLNGRLERYEGYKGEQEVFLKMDDSCIWLQKELLKTDIVSISHLMGNLNVVGFVLKEQTDEMPKVIVAIAIYL